MIYLIGGSARSGKSTLSKKLSNTLGIPYISTDYLRQTIMPYFKGEAAKKAFPFEYTFDFKGWDDFFKHCTGKEMLQDDIVEAKTLWPGIKSLIDHLLKNKTDYIIEGVHLMPSLINHYKTNKEVKVVFLIKQNKDKIFNGLKANKNNNDWIASNIKDDKTLLNAAKSLCKYGIYFSNETKKYKLKCINTENGFHNKINKAIEHMTN